MRLFALVVAAALLASCASADKEKGAGTPAKEVAAGAARVRGGGIRMDVQVGRQPTDRTGKADTTIVAPNAVVAP
jgi:outer membrane murein-binding lipoprotein Lpp